jgi:hypothetical protein
MSGFFDTTAPGADSSDSLEKKTQSRASNEINAALTPGLIHEVNNILTGIYFNLEGCREVLDASHPLAESVQEIQVGVERIKEVLGRITQIYLNAAEREQTYHEAQALVAGQIDLLRIVFPKTASITLTAPESPLYINVSEYAFRVALLTLATCLRGLYPEGKIEIPMAVLCPEDLSEADLGKSTLAGDCVGVSFRLPCVALSVAEIDDFQTRNQSSDLSMAAAEVLVGEAGGRLLFSKGEAPQTSDVVMLFPLHNLNT